MFQRDPILEIFMIKCCCSKRKELMLMFLLELIYRFDDDYLNRTLVVTYFKKVLARSCLIMLGNETDRKESGKRRQSDILLPDVRFFIQVHASAMLLKGDLGVGVVHAKEWFCFRVLDAVQLEVGQSPRTGVWIAFRLIGTVLLPVTEIGAWMHLDFRLIAFSRVHRADEVATRNIGVACEGCCRVPETTLHPHLDGIS